MTRKPRSNAGRPQLGDAARNTNISVKLSAIEIAAIESAVATDNAARTGGERAVTVSSWIRDRALEALGNGEAT